MLEPGVQGLRPGELDAADVAAFLVVDGEGVGAVADLYRGHHAAAGFVCYHGLVGFGHHEAVGAEVEVLDGEVLDEGFDVLVVEGHGDHAVVAEVALEGEVHLHGLEGAQEGRIGVGEVEGHEALVCGGFVDAVAAAAVHRLIAGEAVDGRAGDHRGGTEAQIGVCG